MRDGFSNRSKASWAHGAPLLLSLILFALALLVWQQSTVFANGRATLVVSQESGPYRVDISLLPGRAVVGTTHVSVFLRALESEEVLTDADVGVSATGPVGSTTIQRRPALNRVSPNLFEANLPFDMAGEWEMVVDITSQLGETALTLPLEVKEGGGRINTILIAAFVVIVLAIGIFMWGRFPRRGASGR